jgi:hypothetical protein
MQIASRAKMRLTQFIFGVGSNHEQAENMADRQKDQSNKPFGACRNYGANDLSR